MRVLVIEDEIGLAEAIGNLLSQRGYEVDLRHTVFDGMEAGLSDGYDCIVADVRLPDGNGIEMVDALREAGCRTPVLILTVQNDPHDRVKGLNAGADDYLGKPFLAEELLARINALVRRASDGQELDELSYGRARLRRNSRTLQLGQSTTELSSKEFMLLEHLFRHPNQVLTREQLVAHLWGPEAEVADSALDTYVYFLRKKAAQMGWRSIIRTVRGQGYALGQPV